MRKRTKSKPNTQKYCQWGRIQWMKRIFMFYSKLFANVACLHPTNIWFLGTQFLVTVRQNMPCFCFSSFFYSSIDMVSELMIILTFTILKCQINDFKNWYSLPCRYFAKMFLRRKVVHSFFLCSCQVRIWRLLQHLSLIIQCCYLFTFSPQWFDHNFCNSLGFPRWVFNWAACIFFSVFNDQQYICYDTFIKCGCLELQRANEN